MTHPPGSPPTEPGPGGDTGPGRPGMFRLLIGRALPTAPQPAGPRPIDPPYPPPPPPTPPLPPRGKHPGRLLRPLLFGFFLAIVWALAFWPERST